jgi:hypothetical protein
MARLKKFNSGSQANLAKMDQNWPARAAKHGK